MARKNTEHKTYSTHTANLAAAIAKGVFVSPNNTKLGDIPSYSKIPGANFTYPDGTPIWDIEGSCVGCSENCGEYCYCRNMAMFRPSCAVSWLRNQELMEYMPREVVEECWTYAIVHKSEFFRVHVAGDFASYEELCIWLEGAKDMHHCAYMVGRPCPTLYAYTHRWQWVNRWLDENGGELPEGFTIRLSRQVGDDVENPYDLPEFWVDFGDSPEVAEMPHCPAVDAPKKAGGKGRANGFTCEMCGPQCADRNCKKRAVYVH